MNEQKGWDVLFSAWSPGEMVDFSFPSLCCFLHFFFLYSRKSIMVNVHCFLDLLWAVLWGSHPFSRGCTQSPPSPLVQCAPLRFWCDVSSELRLDVDNFCCFISGDMLTWYANKPEGDYTRWNINKNSSFPFPPYLRWFFAPIQSR